MLMRLPYVLALLMTSSVAVGQTATSHSPAAKPAPSAAATPSATPGGNPAAAPSPVYVDTALAPVQPGHPGVTQRVQNANTHDVDARGHTLDPNGKPVGQAVAPSVMPASASTVH